MVGVGTKRRKNRGFSVAGLFAGIGGIELGLHSAGHTTELLCESWAPAQSVLRSQPEFRDVPLHGDVTKLEDLSDTIDVVSAGFPCTDLSQAGYTRGITGDHSGLVTHLFKLLRRREDRSKPLTWVVIENVQNMLVLDRGEAMRYLTSELEALGYRWAYRVVDSRFTGLPQRRRRVLLVASTTNDPRGVLFSCDAGPRPDTDYANDAFGFYWTEGYSGLGWAQDATPTLKGGSTLGIPSPPAIWVPDALPDRRLITPQIEDAEELQGFERGWTAAAHNSRGRTRSDRWKLVGNAVTVRVSTWLGLQLAAPGSTVVEGQLWEKHTWPAAAWGEDGSVWKVDVSEFPEHQPYEHLREIVDVDRGQPLSNRAAAGFRERLERGNLGWYPGFREAVADYVKVTAC